MFLVLNKNGHVVEKPQTTNGHVVEKPQTANGHVVEKTQTVNYRKCRLYINRCYHRFYVFARLR